MKPPNFIAKGGICVATYLLLLNVAFAQTGPIGVSGATGPSGTTGPSVPRIATLGCESYLSEPVDLGAPVAVDPPLIRQSAKFKSETHMGEEAAKKLMARAPDVLKKLGLSCPKTNGKCFHCTGDRFHPSVVDGMCRALATTPSPTNFVPKVQFDSDANKFLISGTVRFQCDYGCENSGNNDVQ